MTHNKKNVQNWTTRVINIEEEALAVGADALWEVAPVAAKSDAPGPGDHC